MANNINNLKLCGILLLVLAAIGVTAGCDEYGTGGGYGDGGYYDSGYYGGGYGPIDEDVFQNHVDNFSDYLRG